MDADNIRKKLKGRNITIVILVLVIVLLCCSDVLLYLNNNELKKENTKLKNEEPALTESEAMKKGKELYDKATEIYTLYSFKLPYCGYSKSEVSKQKMTKFEEELKEKDDKKINLEQQTETVKNETSYYKSNYRNLDSLKKYLSNYLSEDLIEKNIKPKEKVIKDLVLLQNETYTGSNYVEYSGALYCKATSDYTDESRYIEKYTSEVNPYDIKIVYRDRNKISYMVKSKYVSNDVKDFNAECKNDINKCIITSEKQFTIEKTDGKWLVTVFNIHE